MNELAPTCILVVLWLMTNCDDVGSRAVRLAFSEVSQRLYYTDWETGSINVIDVLQSEAKPQPLITGLINPLPITTHPQLRYALILCLILTINK